MCSVHAFQCWTLFWICGRIFLEQRKLYLPLFFFWICKWRKTKAEMSNCYVVIYPIKYLANFYIHIRNEIGFIHFSNEISKISLSCFSGWTNWMDIFRDLIKIIIVECALQYRQIDYYYRLNNSHFVLHESKLHRNV